MTEGIINADGSRNWQANILLDNVKRLEQENKQMKSALEEIKTIINQPCDNCKYNKDDITCSIGDCGEGKLKIIENRVNEVLNDI